MGKRLFAQRSERPSLRVKEAKVVGVVLIYERVA